MYGVRLWLLCLLLLMACGIEEQNASRVTTGNEFIFGHFFGECLGESCVEIFRLTDDDLSEDTLDRYPSSDQPYEGRYIRLADEKREQVKDLIQLIPSELFAITQTRIGMPDAGDWGGFYLEWNDGKTRRFWLMDKNELYLPEALKPFARILTDRISLLQK